MLYVSFVFSPWEIQQDDVFNVAGSAFVASQVGVQPFDQMGRFAYYPCYISAILFVFTVYIIIYTQQNNKSVCVCVYIHILE